MTNTDRLAQAIDLLEPTVLRNPNWNPEQSALMSIAISVKRIADVMERCNSYGETGSEAIGNSILRGMQGVRT